MSDNANNLRTAVVLLVREVQALAEAVDLCAAAFPDDEQRALTAALSDLHSRINELSFVLRSHQINRGLEAE